MSRGPVSLLGALVIVAVASLGLVSFAFAQSAAAPPADPETSAHPLG